MKKKLVEINLNEWHYQCGDGCCDLYGTNTTINGVELENQNQDTGNILRQVLEHLGYEVEITVSEDGEVQYRV